MLSNLEISQLLKSALTYAFSVLIEFAYKAYLNFK